MKSLLLVLAVVLSQSVLAADKKPLTKEGSAKVIEKAIRKAAKKPTGELTKADFEKLTGLNLQNNQLIDVSGLKKLTQLKTLWLHNNQLTNVKSLGELTQLMTLGLDENQLTDVKRLEKLTQLKVLYLVDNQLTELPKGLENLTQLKALDLRNNPDLTKAHIEELKKALPQCKIASTPPLTKEESAKVLEAAIREAAGKPAGELTKADLEKVTTLTLSENQLADVPKGLEKLTQLTELDLGGSQLTDVKGLEKLTQLKELNLGKNPNLTKAQIAELQKALPKCRIYSNPTK